MKHHTVSRNKQVVLIFSLAAVSVFPVLTLGLAAHASTSAEKVKKETVEAVDAAGAYAGEKKEEFAARMKTNLDEIDREIQTLKAESEQKSTEARDATKKKIQELHVKRDELRKRYDAFERSTGKAWTRMKTGIEKAWGDVRTAYSEAKSELEAKK